jgi:endonuclease YncB( thermonuclease family)
MDWNIIPFRRRKPFDWLEGVTPRKRSSRFPIKPAALGLALGVLMAVVAIWLPPVDFSRLKLPSMPPQHHPENTSQPQTEPSQGGQTDELSRPSAEPSPEIRADFDLCFVGSGYNCVVDGDTFWYHGSRVRMADIDTPETHPPRCAREAELGRRATLRLQELLNQGPFTLEAIDQDHDQYGRELRIVTRNGASLGSQLVNEGLARRWTGHREPWR